jgi:ribokinase
MKRPSIVIVGSCNIDLVAYTPRVPEPGETVLGDRFVMGFGGKGANQAVMAARLGAAVSMVGALGNDLYRDMTLANFAEQGVDTSNMGRLDGSSGVAPIWVEPDGTNRIIVVAGANDRVDPVASGRAVAEAATLDVVVGQFEIPQAVTLAAFRAARARGATTVLNPAPAAPIDLELLALTDWLVPNEHELATIAGPDLIGSDDELAGWATREGFDLVVTVGGRGAILVSDRRVTRVAAAPATAIDTTGAGDAFVGAFAVGLGLGLTPLQAVGLGVGCASDSVSRPGTQASYPDRERAAELLAAALRDDDKN